MGEIRNKILEQDYEEERKEKKQMRQEKIDHLMLKIGSNDKTIRRVVEVLYDELKRF